MAASVWLRNLSKPELLTWLTGSGVPAHQGLGIDILRERGKILVEKGLPAAVEASGENPGDVVEDFSPAVYLGESEPLHKAIRHLPVELVTFIRVLFSLHPPLVVNFLVEF